MQSIKYLTKEALKDIKLLILDVDGVLVPRGTKIKQEGDKTTFEIKRIGESEINKIKQLREKGYEININSGRALTTLQEMFREVLPFTSLTYENGSATWFKGEMHQHINSYNYLKHLYPELRAVRHKNILGWEPKEFIITIHCKERVKEIEDILAKEDKLYCLWNGEAYDIGVKDIQTKAVGVRALYKLLNLERKNVMVIGDNYNDEPMMKEGGIAVTADRTRVKGNYYVDLNGKTLPAGQLMGQMLKVSSV